MGGRVLTVSLAPVEGFTSYIASSEGRIFSLTLDRYLLGSVNGRGYVHVTLRDDQGRKKYRDVHRLIALAFLPNPENKRTVNHKDGDKTNNRLSNLEWATHAENLQHAYDTKLRLPRSCPKHDERRENGREDGVP